MPKKRATGKAGTPLEAVESGDLKRLQEVLGAGADVNESEEGTALAKAAELGRADMVKALLKAGADPDWGGIWVPLCQAVSSGNLEVVNLLIDAKAKVDAQEEDGSTALITAAASGNLPMAKLLVAAGANPKLRDEDGQSAIVAGRNSPAIVEFLKPLSTKKDVEAAAERPQATSASAKEFLEAARTGNATRVSELLARGTPVNAAKDDGEAALHLAVGGGHEEVVELLLRAGAKVNAKDRYGRTPLREAAHSGNLALAERLLAAGADVNVRDKLEGKAPFLASIGRRKDQRDMMRLLARHGADVNAVDDYGRTALSLADRDLGHPEYADDEERREQEALRRVFIEIGLLHPEAGALTAAAAKGDLVAVRRLLASGVPIDACDEQERTALYMAVSRRRPAVVECLLQAKADLHKAIGRDEGIDVQWGGMDQPCPQCGTVFAAIEKKRHCPHCAKEFDAHETFGSNLGDQPLFVSWGNGFVPLMAAAKVGDVAITRMLLDAGADVNRGKTGITPLMTACYYDHLEEAKLLIEHGADTRKETKTPDRGKERISAVTIAADRKNIAIVTLLWDAGVPVKDKKPTLLVDAARRGDLTQIEELLAQGASAVAEDPLTKDEPLAAAASAGQAEALMRLIQAGAPVNPQSHRQMPALFLAMDAAASRSKQGKLSVAELARYVATAKCLLEAGAKPDAGIFGVRPIDQAKEARCQPLVELLEEATRREKESKKKR